MDIAGKVEAVKGRWAGRVRRGAHAAARRAFVPWSVTGWLAMGRLVAHNGRTPQPVDFIVCRPALLRQRSRWPVRHAGPHGQRSDRLPPSPRHGQAPPDTTTRHEQQFNTTTVFDQLMGESGTVLSTSSSFEVFDACQPGMLLRGLALVHAVLGIGLLFGTRPGSSWSIDLASAALVGVAGHPVLALAARWAGASGCA